MMRRTSTLTHLFLGGALAKVDTIRIGQNHIYTVYIRYFWQGNHRIYGHIRCIYTVLANPRHYSIVESKAFLNF